MRVIAILLTVASASYALGPENQCPAEQITDWTIEMLLPHADCDRYYKCTFGEPVEQACPPYTLFNVDTLKCDWIGSVECGDRNNPFITVATDTTPSNSPSTTPSTTTSTTPSTTTITASNTTESASPSTTEEDEVTEIVTEIETTVTAVITGFTTDEEKTENITTTTTPAPTESTTPPSTEVPTSTTTEPSSSTTTEPSTSTTTEPPTSTTTDLPTSTTTEPSSSTTVEPSNSTTASPTTSTSAGPTTSTTTPPTTEITGTTSADEFLPNGCPVDFHIHWLLPHEEDCSLFYYCAWGKKLIRSCPGTLHFNKELQVCDWPVNAGCTATAA